MTGVVTIVVIIAAVFLSPFLTAWTWNTAFNPELTKMLFGVDRLTWMKAFCLGLFVMMFKANGTKRGD